MIPGPAFSILAPKELQSVVEERTTLCRKRLNDANHSLSLQTHVQGAGQTGARLRYRFFVRAIEAEFIIFRMKQEF